MIHFKIKITILSILLIVLFILPVTHPGSAIYEYKVHPGAYMEYTVSEAQNGNKSTLNVGLNNDEGIYTIFNMSKDDRIRVDVTDVNKTSYVIGQITFQNEMKSANISLDYLYVFDIGTSIPIVQQMTDREIYMQDSINNLDRLQGNLLTTSYEWSGGTGQLYQQEMQVNIVSGWVEFFSFIFSVNDTPENIFSMTRSKPVVRGYEIATTMVPVLIFGILVFIKRNRKN